MRFPKILSGHLRYTVLAFAIAGCTTILPESPIAPTTATPTRVSLALQSLPPPRARIPVAVYSNEDLTGQYKEQDNGQTLSRAVTQGGAPMLMRALQQAGGRTWFTVLERAELDILLQERQILTEMRRIYRSEQSVEASVLPPLLSASIIMEGAIVGYDTNTVTGGIGARLLGIGADQKYQHDTVTVSLRAISAKTGEVLNTVTASKAVASIRTQGNVFRFINLEELLEAEAGVSINEPRYIAVRQAIDAAVIAMILEGSEIGIWDFADPAGGRALVAAYRNGMQLEPAPRVGVSTANPTSVVQTAARPPAPSRTAKVTQVTRPLPAGTPRAAQPQQMPTPASPANETPPAPSADEPALGSRPQGGESISTAVALLDRPPE
ncbi:CsgG/HfaB family protein [Profundibacterium mesophilum]|uniref:Curli production assemblytransport outer membrane lipoprotein component CsgG n=1 Tax=Profundibacterium mesophilum KAUST100406-0324 TaxID=1037889 RepID=A0A921NYR2_9RHOB|nr:CsgG/HfaB family protein [Profundibacterium mesophilum]KAF0677154.1 Curli production assemblytransport outer membrane lipoprotein component CsgG [Profundibacterium mesophilum KAUST100406-0324]